MDASQFQSPAGELRRISPTHGQPYLSFIPQPLPPPDEAQALAAIRHLLSKADQALGELIGVGRLLPDPNLLVRPYLRQEAVASSAIEGTRASFTDLVAYEVGGVTPPNSDVVDVFNYTAALDFGLHQVQDQGITPDLVRSIHRKLMAGARGEAYATPGEFRSIQNHIGGGREPADGDFVPPPPEQMQTCLSDLFGYIAEEGDARAPLLVEAAWIHYQFETIHPFIDGNGRVGRVLIPLLIAHRRAYPHPLMFLSPYFRRHRSSYTDLLFDVSSKNAWTPWLRFFLEGVVEQAHKAITLSDQILALGREWHARLDSNRASHNAHRLSEYLLQHVAITAGLVAMNLGVSEPTAYSMIRILESHGIVDEITGRPRDRVWICRELLHLLDPA